VASVVDNITG